MRASCIAPGPLPTLRTCLLALLGLMPGSVPLARPQDPPPVIECELIPPDLMSYPRLVGSPSHVGSAYDPTPYADLSITVLYNGQPLADAYVEILFGSACDALCLCGDAQLAGYTDGQGRLELNIGVGGCCESYDAVIVRAEGIPVRALDMFVSPDYCATGGDCQVTLCDFSYFGVRFMAGSSGCTDLTGSGATAVDDFVVFASGGWGRDCPPR